MGPFRTIRFPRGWWWWGVSGCNSRSKFELNFEWWEISERRAIAINIVTRVSGESGEREGKKVDDDTISRLE
jgi:hypothetical protein